MKKYVILLCLLVTCYSTFSQGFNEDQVMEHYWYYRNRLKYFVAPGEDYGQSQMVCIRNTFYPTFCGTQYPNNDRCNLDFGQHNIYFGYYLGVLATEYHLLGLANRTEDQQNTGLELYYAVRNWQHYLDSCEANYPGGIFLNSVVDGFFMRSDARSIFNNNNNLEYLNDGLTLEDNDWQANNSSYSFGQVPEGYPGYAKLVNSEDCVGYYEAMSQDEAYGLLLGLALIKRFMEGTTVGNMATTIANNVINYMANSQFYGAWFFLDPNGNQVPGGDAWTVGWGCAKAAQYFGYPWQNFINPGTQLIQYSTWEAFQGNPIGAGGESNASMFVTLAAIGDSWEIPHPFPLPHMENTTWQGIDMVITQDWESFYELLYKTLHFDAPIPASNLEDYRNDAKNKLTTLPDEGPYYYADNHRAGGGWAATYRWHKQITDQNGGNWEFSGNYNGLDIMLLENLHLIIEAYFGPGIDLKNYHPYVNGKLCEVLPVKYNGTRIIGSDAEPTQRVFFKTITSTSQIQANTNYSFTNGNITPLPDPIIGVSGNVNYIAEKEITLKHGQNGVGFTVEKGAKFIAKIKQPLIFYNNFDINSIQLETNQCDPSDNQNLKFLTFSQKNVNDPKFQSKTSNYLIYPNPVINTLNIKCKNSSSNAKRITIYNQIGNIVFANEVTEDNLEIDFSQFAVGLYFINIYNTESCSTFKIMKSEN